MTRLTLLLAALLLAGCSTLKGITIPTEQFAATLSATGVVLVPPASLGTIRLPTGGQSLVALVAALAGPYLAQNHQLKACVFTTYPETVDRGVTVTASAACKLNGIPVSEIVTVSLVPVT